MGAFAGILPIFIIIVLVWLLRSCILVVKEWERLIILRLGKFQGLRKPGLAIILPLIDRVVARIDTRIQVTPFQAQQTLTRDTVPVDVDAVLFWYVFDVKKASLEVTDY